MTTRPDLDALEQLANAATPGPWEHKGCGFRVGICFGFDDDSSERDMATAIANAAFIAAARTALPALVAYARRLEGEAALAKDLAYAPEAARLRARLADVEAANTRLRAELAKVTEERDDHMRGAEGLAVLVDEVSAERDAARAAVKSITAIKREEMQALLEEVRAAGHAALPQVCGWCVQAAGGDEAAWVAAPRYTLDEARAHTLSCPHNPLVVRAERAETAVAARIVAWLRERADRAHLDDPAGSIAVDSVSDDIESGAWRGKEQA